MNYLIIIISLTLGLIFGYFILKYFKDARDIVWFIMITFILASMSVFIIDRYIYPDHHLIRIALDFLLGLLFGLYIYLILVGLGIIKQFKK